MLLRQIPGQDVVHVFTAGYFSFLLVAAPALVLGKILGKRTVLHYHDGRALDHLKRSTVAVLLCGLADALITPSNFLVEVFAKFGLKAQPIANVLEAQNYTFRLRSNLQPRFLHNRGLKPEYNPACTIRAFARIQERYPNASLTIANDGYLRHDLETLVTRLRLRNVNFVGNVSQDHMPALYNAADIFLSSADHDNMPGSIVEAFAAGIPVIATRAGGTSWVVNDEEDGLLVNCGDYRAMAESAFRLLEEPALVERLTRAAHEKSLCFSWSQIGGQWNDLYSRLSRNCEFRTSFQGVEAP